MLNRNVLVLVGLLGWTALFAAFTWQLWARGNESLDWPSASGSVTLDFGRREGAPIQIEVEYTVDGKSFQQTWDRYVLEDEVPVYYDPKDPSRAVLNKGVDWPHFALHCIAAGIGAVGAIATASLLLFPSLESKDSAYYSRGQPSGDNQGERGATSV